MKPINVKELLNDLKVVLEKHEIKEISNFDNAYLGFDENGVFGMTGCKIVSLENNHKTVPIPNARPFDFKENCFIRVPGVHF